MWRFLISRRCLIDFFYVYQMDEVDPEQIISVLEEELDSLLSKVFKVRESDHRTLEVTGIAYLLESDSVFCHRVFKEIFRRTRHRYPLGDMTVRDVTHSPSSCIDFDSGNIPRYAQELLEEGMTGAERTQAGN